MGYYTNFTLSWDDGNDVEIEHKAIELGINDSCSILGSSVESCKWYNHEDDMRKFSTHFPSVLFTLIGEGEEPGDMWYKYFRNGKMQVCEAKITFDEFDERKLV